MAARARPRVSLLSCEYMRLLGAFCALLVGGLPVLCAPSVPLSEYKQRREALRKQVTDGIIVLFGRTEREHGDLRSPFFQEPNFYYLTGWSEPGATLVMTSSEEMLLIPKRDPEQEKWTGAKAAAGDPNLATLTGFDKVGAIESFETLIPKWLETARKVYTLTREPSADQLRKLIPLREVADVSNQIARLRMVKSQTEISMIQHATDAGVEAHKAAWKAIKPSVTEYHIAAVMSKAYFDKGCERHAYAPIVGSGPNAATLHYSKNRRTMDRGELVLMDVGPECAMYATDITRTVPVNGKFTQRQREIYDIVLGAQKAAIAAMKPGVMLGSRFTKSGLHKIAADYIDSHGKDKHGNSLGKYFTHSLGHHVGLDVHDATDATLPLAAGMIITIEPGIYIPEEGIGVRIEDMVLVTENGAKLLSSSLPRDPDEIERAMASR
jgi:Xaa-Pro aminopeptidase